MFQFIDRFIIYLIIKKRSRYVSTQNLNSNITLYNDINYCSNNILFIYDIIINNYDRYFPHKLDYIIFTNKGFELIKIPLEEKTINKTLILEIYKFKNELIFYKKLFNFMSFFILLLIYFSSIKIISNSSFILTQCS